MSPLSDPTSLTQTLVIRLFSDLVFKILVLPYFSISLTQYTRFIIRLHLG